MVVVGGSESFESAILELAAARPDLSAQVLSTLEAMRATIQDRGVPLSSQREELTAEAVDRISDGIRVQSTDGLTATTQTTESGDLEPTAVTAASSPSFEGAQRLDSLRCGSSGCTVVASITHNHIIDLGYTTFRSTGKTSGSRTGWSYLKAAGYCFIDDGSRPSCGGQYTYPSGSTWSSKLLSFSRVPSPAKISVTFSGTYGGVAGTVTGYTPRITCTNSTKQCRFA